MTTDSARRPATCASGSLALRAELAGRPDIELGPDGLPVGRSAASPTPVRRPGRAAAAPAGPTGGRPPEPREPDVIRPSSVMRRTL